MLTRSRTTQGIDRPGTSLLALVLGCGDCGDSVAIDTTADTTSSGTGVPTGTDGPTSSGGDPDALCFDAPFSVAVSLEHPIALRRGDFDGDGSTDILVLGLESGYAGRALYGVAGTFVPGEFGSLPIGCDTQSIVLDLDDDGRSEVAFANCFAGIEVHHVELDGTFSPFAAIPVADVIHQFAHLDVNADGIRDLVLLTTTGDALDLSVLPGMPGQSFGPAVVSPQPVQFADEPAAILMRVAASDPVEVVIAQEGASHGFARSQHAGGGGFAVPAWIATDFAIGGLVFSDVDADGATDVLVVDQGAGQVHALLGAAHDPGPVTPLTGDWFTVVPGELDGAGALDLAVVRTTEVDILAGQGDGSFALVDTVDFGDYIVDKHLVLTDLDGDGRDDLVAGFFNPFPFSAMVAQSCPF